MILKSRPIQSREFLQGVVAAAVLSTVRGVSSAKDASAAQSRSGQEGVTKGIVMLHRTSAGGWCFDQFRAVFEDEGWTCYTPDPKGHGKDKEGADQKLVGVGLTDYCAEFAAFLSTVPPRPVWLGHSMGALLAQQLASGSPALSFW